MMDKNEVEPKIIETSRSTSIFFLILGFGWLFLSIFWLFNLNQIHHNGITLFMIQINFALCLWLSVIFILMYSSYSRPNIILHRDKLKIHCFHAKGEVELNKIDKIVTGCRFKNWLWPKNRVYCLNDSLTLKDKICISLRAPIAFATPFKKNKKVQEVIIDVLNVSDFIFDIEEREPKIQIVKKGVIGENNDKTYHINFEMRTQM